MISIVIPLYNKESYIKDTLKMIFNQTFQNFEIVIIDDGSTDNGPKFIHEFSDRRINFFSKENGGVSSARNMGIEKSSFEYIAFLDADDIWTNNHLEIIFNMIVKYDKEADVFVTNFSRKYPDGRLIINRLDIKEGIIDDYFSEVLFKDVIHTSCVCVRKKALDKVGHFNTQVSRGEDLDLWIRLNREFKTAYSPIVTEYYLQDAINNSRKKFPIDKSIVFHLKKEKIHTKSEKIYLRNLIIRKSLSLIIKEQRIIDSIKLLWNKKNILI
ncbi:glycosyltransferase family A protein [Empedobacter sp. GD03739]|uniref:glycosyltransferase family 2 protein n=1 Tax=Empedobacter sp. GD03739 TaxID=2975376 RepID=UPI00244B1A4E|nr:glycosyltransferase family A protein [Empedobacter sp. GD03739]MDH1601215.1 glycosyltransferase family 2 protein [Empedobacter sp. GD03739]